jgi:hypothetical protein
MARSPFVRVMPLLAGALLASLAAAPSALAQSATSAAPAAPPRAPAPPAARAEDVASIDAILDALYDVISGNAGEPRDWDRMRSLFLPGARLIPTRPTDGGGAAARVMSVEDWIAGAESYFEQAGFHEREIGRRVERYGNIAHAFSAYESVHAPAEPAFARGVNSIQLMKDGGRWWVVTIFWDAEREGNPVPADLIGKKP